MELFVLDPHMLACKHVCTGVDAEVYAGVDAEGAVARAGAHARG